MRIPLRHSLLFAAALLCAPIAFAQMGAASASGAQVAIDAPWVRATVPRQPATGAFMRLTAARDLRLVGARSPAAEHVEVHEMAMQGQMMRMRQVASLDLPKGRAVALAPGGYHLMLIGLQRPLRAGEKVALTLLFEDADGKRSEQQVHAEVRPLATPAS
ncbi:copper chaperone PCu(A)C [Lysobacter enzymogenes]|uniref:copper chaperone PCu(A)C n=1 Tax=Lysobacter enzymogenes TaxID=69 RepID=UPI001AF23712|nr:copper chaperone PCu(A)C [Lysobacter enzymogenes]QQQ01582.1 copper chaperone PCu(A)C [Lysobacter enzymogenes]